MPQTPLPSSTPWTDPSKVVEPNPDFFTGLNPSAVERADRYVKAIGLKAVPTPMKIRRVTIYLDPVNRYRWQAQSNNWKTVERSGSSFKKLKKAKKAVAKLFPGVELIVK